MTPVNFPESNAVLARDQPEYEPLPIYVFPNDDTGRVAFCLALSEAEIVEIRRTGKIWLQQLTFGRRFQPIALTTQRPDDMPVRS